MDIGTTEGEIVGISTRRYGARPIITTEASVAQRSSINKSAPQEVLDILVDEAADRETIRVIIIIRRFDEIEEAEKISFGVRSSNSGPIAAIATSVTQNRTPNCSAPQEVSILRDFPPFPRD